MKDEILQGDALEVLRTLPDACIDSIVTDPPYGLGFMGVGWDTFAHPKGSMGRDKSIKFDHVGGNHNPINAQDAARIRRSENQKFEAWNYKWAVEALRVAKPGAHLLAFGGTRTYHRLACAIEDAGWEVRDCFMWLYGSGFPKSMDISRLNDCRFLGNRNSVYGRGVVRRSRRACPSRCSPSSIARSSRSAGK